MLEQRADNVDALTLDLGRGDKIDRHDATGRLLEDVLYLLKDALFGFCLLPIQPSKLLDQLPLLGCKLGGNLYMDLYQLVAGSMAPDVWDSQTFEPQDASALGARWNFQCGLAFEGGHLDLS